MRTDVKLGVVFALVMVLAAGGYFMFRGEKQTPISLAGKNPGPEIKTQPSKPGTAAKPSVNLLKTPATTPTANGNRPPINPRPMANNTNVPASPVAPVVTPAINKPSVAAQPPASAPDAVANPATLRPANPTPLTASRSGPDVSSPAVTTNTNPIMTSGLNRPIPATTPTANAPTSSSVVADRPAAPATGMEVGLTGIPNSASQPANPTPARPNPAVTMTPLTNSPSASAPSTSPTTIPDANNALPPGIPAATAPKSEASSIKKSGLADAAVETHKVQVGDSLSSLAQTYYGDSKYAKVLADANSKLSDPNRLKVGSLVSIPPLPTDTDSRAARETTALASAKPGDKPAADGKRTYTVKAGDSFCSIARSQLGSESRWKELLALNNSTVKGDPTALQPGQRLVLPEAH